MLAALKARFNGADDFCLRELTAGGQVLYALFLDGMTSGSDISDFVVRPLMENLRPGTPEELYAQAQRGAVPPRRRARTPSRARRMRSRRRCARTQAWYGGICGHRRCGWSRSFWEAGAGRA